MKARPHLVFNKQYRSDCGCILSRSRWIFRGKDFEGAHSNLRKLLDKAIHYAKKNI